MIHTIPGSILSKYAQNIEKGLKISVYGDTYLQQYKLELVQDMVHNYHYFLMKRKFYSQWGTGHFSVLWDCLQIPAYWDFHI